jgi:hypothetical protein
MITVEKDISHNLNLFVNGELLEKAQVHMKTVNRLGKDMIYYDIYADDYQTSIKLLNCSKHELNEINVIRLKNWFRWTNFYNYILIEPSYDSKGENQYGQIFITFGLIPDAEVWTYPFSFSDFCQEFLNLFNTFVNLRAYADLEFRASSRFGVFLELGEYNQPTGTIIDYIKNYEKDFEECHNKAIKNLASYKQKKNIYSYFEFPKELKTTCEQYLLYFAQFLQDLGINATSNLKEEAGKVLFSVTPTDDVEALDKIREALAVYLNLPSSPIVYDESFAAMRLQQQIENLQHSQRMAVRELQFNEKLLIAQSDTIREKNLTISQQQSVIEQKDKIIEKISSKSIMMDSAENKEELEEIYDGLKIGESKFLKEQLGIHLNPAKVIKTAVKNTFGENEKKSVLGLEEES